MPEIVSLEDHKCETLGKQAPNGFKKKSDKQLLREQEELSKIQFEEYKAGQEQARLRGMEQWYAQSEQHVTDLYLNLGFPAHASSEEKRKQIVKALTHAAALFASGEKDIDPAKSAKEYEDQIASVLASVKEQNAVKRTANQASVVAALIIEPKLWERLTPPVKLADALVEPWLTLPLADGEGAVFKALVDVKLHDKPAVQFLKPCLDEAREYTPEAILAGMQRMVPELVALIAAERVPVETPAPDAPEDVRTP